MANITADNADNFIFGSQDRDTIFGLDGDDIIFALGGQDLVDAGLGDDEVHAGSGGGTLLGRLGDDRLFGGDGADGLLGGFDDDLLEGGAGDDSLSGFEGNDRLFGGSGADTLRGDQDDDQLFGGSSGDTFALVFAGAFRSTFGNPDQGNDTIEDFARNVDQIRVIGITGTLDSNNNRRIDDGDRGVNADISGQDSLEIVFDGRPLQDGGTAEGTLTVLGVSELTINTDIFFA